MRALGLRFDEERVGFVLDHDEVRVWFPLDDQLPEAPLALKIEPEDIVSGADDDALFMPLPDWMDEAKEVRRLRKQVVDDVYRNETTGQFINRKLKLYGKAKESEEEFSARCKEAVERAIEARAEKLKDRFETKADRLDDKVAAKTAQLAELRGVARSRQLEEAVNIGATIMAFLGGGRKKSVSSMVSKRRQSSRAAHRADRLEDEIERLKDDAAELEAELAEELDEIRSKQEEALEATEQRGRFVSSETTSR